ncbi:MAG: GNAT family N-acetyltransferase [Planctomycetota bacterium]
MTYFRRYRMEMPLGIPAGGETASSSPTPSFPSGARIPSEYEWVPFDERLIREHAQAKYQSFRHELDADVFPCLARRDGCLSLMNEITSRANFVPEATWLVRYRDRPGGRPLPVATIQGLRQEEWGAIQNLGVVPEHRGRGLAKALLARAATGFRMHGLRGMHLEVTTANEIAVRLYHRSGFRTSGVVYKACDIAGT